MNPAENNEEIVSRLKFIGYIDKDEKVDVHRMIKQSNSLLTSFTRSVIYSDNRKNLLAMIKTTVQRVFEIINGYVRDRNFEQCKTLMNDLIKSQQGLLNIKYTYSTDTKFCCDIDVVLEKIAVKIKELYSYDGFDSESD